MRVSCLVLFAVLLAGREAQAIPAFARKYTAPCSLCHAPAYPALNAFGRRYKENGYQLDAQGDLPYRAQKHVHPDPDERLELLPELPLSLRGQSSVVLRPDARESGGNTLDLKPFEQLYLLAGASLYPNVSFFAAAAIAPQAAVHHAALGFHNLLSPEGYANLRVGRLMLLDFIRPEHRFVTGYGNPIATSTVGLNPTVLDSTQHGLEVFGRLFGRRIFYHLAVVQGAQGSDGVADLDDHKDLFAELQITPLHALRAGAFLHRGRTQITDATRGLEVRFTDPWRTLGGFVELDTAPLDLFAQALHSRHDNASDERFHADYWALCLEAQAPLGPRFFLVARYDQLASHHLDALQHATVHLGYLLLSNLRLAAESAIPLDRIEASVLSLRLDVAL